MKNILHISTSPNGQNSFSIRLGNAIAAQLVNAYPDAQIKTIDLTSDPFPHLDPVLVKAIRTTEDQLTDSDRQLLHRSDKAIKELMEADSVVISLPLFNFGIPSVLKTWLDHILRAGITFKYTENGPVGLVTGKKLYIALASGGVYSQGPMQAYDHAVPYLKDVLMFIGISDISVLRAEGTAIPALKDLALHRALEEITV